MKISMLHFVRKLLLLHLALIYDKEMWGEKCLQE